MDRSVSYLHSLLLGKDICTHGFRFANVELIYAKTRIDFAFVTIEFQGTDEWVTYR